MDCHNINYKNWNEVLEKRWGQWKENNENYNKNNWRENGSFEV